MTAALTSHDTRTVTAPRRIVVTDAIGARHFIAGADSISIHGGSRLFVFGDDPGNIGGTERGCLRSFDTPEWREVEVLDQSVDTEPPIARIVNDQWRVAKPAAA